MKDRKLYIGYSLDVEKRVRNHNAGSVLSTKQRRPLELIYLEGYLSEHEAKRREKYLKGGNGKKQLKIQIDKTLKSKNYKFI